MDILTGRVLYGHVEFWYDLTMSNLQRHQARAFRDAFFDRHPRARDIMQLFHYLPSVYFYAKDFEHRYIGINKPTLEDVFGLADEADILGRTDSEFQPPSLAEAYHAEDRRVMEARQTIANQVWLVPHVLGTPRWYVSTKTPMFDHANQVIGIAGVMYPMETPEEQSRYFQDLYPVICYIDQHYTQEINMQEMAGQAQMSATQFNHRFRTLLRMAPTEYVLSLRTQLAQRLLTQTDKSIAEIGSAVGFYDQSHFTKRFRRVTGLTPRKYRERFRSPSPATS